MKMVTNLALSSIKKDKTRSILVTISIFMTTVLLAVIATVGLSLMEANKQNSGIWYGSYFGTYKNMTEEQVSKMQQRSEFTDIGKMEVFGMVDSKKDLYLAWADRMCMEMNHMDRNLEEGSYPAEESEIAGQRSFFRELGYDDPQIGDRITVPYRTDLNSLFEPEEFVISGFLKEPEIEAVSGTAYISDAYYMKRIPEQSRNYKVYFRMDESIGLTTDNVEDTIKELAGKLGIKEKYADDNYMYLMAKLDPGVETITICAVVGFMVICFAVIVIYNIFQVGIVQKVQEYGKLKAIGSTKKQLRQMVLREGMFLTAIGVPAGLLAGYGLAAAIFYWMLGLMAAPGEEIKGSPVFSLPLLFIVAALAVITVWIALKKPMKIVSSISPVEAMRYQESGKRRKGIRRGRKTLSVAGMTMANLSGHKRRTAATIFSMGLSCILFVVIANVLGNMDMEYAARRNVPHGQFQISLDYSRGDKAYPENNLDRILADNPLNQELLEKIAGLEGVTEVGTGYILCAEDKDKQDGGMITIQVLDREDFEKEASSGTASEMPGYDQISKQNGVIYGWINFMEDSGYAIGQKLNLSVFDGTKTAEWTPELVGAFGSSNADLVMTKDTFDALGLGESAIGSIWADCAKSDTETVRTAINGALAGTGHVRMASYADMQKSFESSIQIMKYGGYVFCAIIGFISFMNMANTMITSIITRKQEFGILQAVGMTNRQLNRSLQIEGIFFSAGPVLVAMLLGVPLGYAGFLYCKANGIIGINVYHFPAAELGLMVVALAALQLGLSFLLSRNVKKESLVERIRYHE